MFSKVSVFLLLINIAYSNDLSVSSNVVFHTKTWDSGKSFTKRIDYFRDKKLFLTKLIGGTNEPFKVNGISYSIKNTKGTMLFSMNIHKGNTNYMHFSNKSDYSLSLHDIDNNGILDIIIFNDTNGNLIDAFRKNTKGELEFAPYNIIQYQRKKKTAFKDLLLYALKENRIKVMNNLLSNKEITKNEYLERLKYFESTGF